MINLSGKQVSGVAKLSERHTAEFKKLVSTINSYGDAAIKLDLTDLDIKGLWKHTGFFKLAVRPNITLVLDPETADVLKSYTVVTGQKVSYEIREREATIKIENPDIQQMGEVYVKYASVSDSAISFKIADTGLNTLSSIGISGQAIQRSLEILSKQAYNHSLKFRVDFTGIDFEGGCDSIIADTLVESRKKYKIPVRVYGNDGIAEYVRVAGNVKLPEERKIQFFKRIQPGTVLRLNNYRTTRCSDIAGRKGEGIVAGFSVVIYKGVQGTDALYDEIPIRSLYSEKDLAVMGEDAYTGDTCIPRRRNLEELGIYGLCSGAYAHLSAVDKNEVYQVSTDDGTLIEISESEFIARGLKVHGIRFNEDLLKQRKIITSCPSRQDGKKDERTSAVYYNPICTVTSL